MKFSGGSIRLLNVERSPEELVDLASTGESRGCLHNHVSSCALSSRELRILQSKSIQNKCGCTTSFVSDLPIVLELM
jgi:hypothetical protein